MFRRSYKNRLPPVEETARDFRVVDGEPYLDEIFEHDRDISRGFARSELTEEEYKAAYSRVVNNLFSFGVHKFFVAVDRYDRYLGHVWVRITEDAVDFVPTAYVLDIETLVQGVGIGSALLERAEEWARLEGARKVSLRVELGNPFLTWYLKRGYRKRALILEKPLQAREKDSQGK
ncbi:GNAT family N-acetyltransferase [Thermococcus celer]|uniref:Acetyltransferase n=1 Tax=Thermococcus celer Vu 13 = JCM 8558 TaxID=1293037 RepID=A0A218P131_THECE|nr:GNAT family N-acetyltransferase [Thermococcus celer]ASI98638.1 acetyltransferase [Thermococcus celer] [Thermococcus celer Vu 13 = JCM 8558]